MSERVSIGSIRDGGFVKLPAGIYEGALSDVFLAVTAASGSVTSMFFFEVVLFLIFLAEAVILNFLVPLVNVYMMIQVMGNLTGEEFCRSLLSFWKTDGLDAKDHAGVCDRDQCRTGNPFSCIGLPETKFCYKTVEAIPGLGNMAGSVMDVVLGTAVLIKTGLEWQAR